jgi:hypothetical protein
MRSLQNLLEIETVLGVKKGYASSFTEEGMIVAKPGNFRKEFLNWTAIRGVSLA